MHGLVDGHSHPLQEHQYAGCLSEDKEGPGPPRSAARNHHQRQQHAAMLIEPVKPSDHFTTGFP
jgi:hypothetical protein